jgi:hypothetical protein
MHEISFSVVTRFTWGVFTALRVLKLNIAMKQELLPAPATLPSLVTLVFTCTTSTPYYVNLETPGAQPHVNEYWPSVSSFLRNLPRLTTLQLKEWDRSAPVEPALSPNLRKLDFSTRMLVGFSPPLRNDHVLRLAELCPLLEDLALETRRSRGNQSEVALYRALGRLPRLQRLRLHLDVSPPPIAYATGEDGVASLRETVIEPWFDARDAEFLPAKVDRVRDELGETREVTTDIISPRICLYRRGHIRDVFVNSAVDSELARSIFEVIDAAKQDATGSVLPLAKLELTTFGGNLFMTGGPMAIHMGGSRRFLGAYLTVLERNWVVERDHRGDGRGLLHARDIDCRGRERHKTARSEYKYPQAIWEEIWSPKEQTGELWDSWTSWPLDLEG